MIVKVVLITAIIAICSSSYANGICPARESDTTVVVPNLRIYSEDLSNEIANRVCVHKLFGMMI